MYLINFIWSSNIYCRHLANLRTQYNSIVNREYDFAALDLLFPPLFFWPDVYFLSIKSPVKGSGRRTPTPTTSRKVAVDSSDKSVVLWVIFMFTPLSLVLCASHQQSHLGCHRYSQDWYICSIGIGLKMYICMCVVFLMSYLSPWLFIWQP